MPSDFRMTDQHTYLHVPGMSGSPVELPKGVLPIVAGSFFSLEGETYRVRETWFILDRHGALDDGHHIYLEETDNQPLDAG